MLCFSIVVVTFVFINLIRDIEREEYKVYMQSELDIVPKRQAIVREMFNNRHFN